METQPLAPGVPYDPGRRQVFGQMDNHDNHTLAAPDAPRKESRTRGYVRFMELTVDEEMWDALVPYMEWEQQAVEGFVIAEAVQF